jgi:hypothetical protein
MTIPINKPHQVHKKYGSGVFNLYLLPKPNQDALTPLLPEDMDTSYARFRIYSFYYEKIMAGGKSPALKL